jgi:hypothetical protein
MRTTQRPNTISGAHVGLALPICVIIALSACGGPGTVSQTPAAHPRGQTSHPTQPSHPSPITVADGSMVVRNADSAPGPNNFTISGGQACSITFGTNAPYPVGELTSWTITSYDQKATVSASTSSGVTTIVASGPNMQSLRYDPYNEGNGVEFGVEQVRFSPPTFSVSGVPTCSYPCKVKIDYCISTCPCPVLP